MLSRSESRCSVQAAEAFKPASKSKGGTAELRDEGSVELRVKARVKEKKRLEIPGGVKGDAGRGGEVIVIQPSTQPISLGRENRRALKQEWHPKLYILAAVLRQ